MCLFLFSAWGYNFAFYSRTSWNDGLYTIPTSISPVSFAMGRFQYLYPRKSSSWSFLFKGFVYEGGLFRSVWWKLFGNEEQYYTSGYQNRIAEIVAHIKEEDKDKDKENKEQELDKDKTPTDSDKLDDNKIQHIIEGSKRKDHKWEKLVPTKDRKEIKKIIEEVMETGLNAIYKEEGRSKIKEIKGVIVEVTYKLVDGVRKIGSAWVR